MHKFTSEMLREYFYWIYIKARSQIISLKTALHSLLTFWIWLNLKFFVAFCSLCMLPIFSFLFLSGTFLNHRFWTFGFAFKCVIWLDPKLICFKSLLRSCRVDFEILIEYRARANQKYFLSFLCRNQCRKGQIVFFYSAFEIPFVYYDSLSFVQQQKAFEKNVFPSFFTSPRSISLKRLENMLGYKSQLFNLKWVSKCMEVKFLCRLVCIR